MKLLGALPLVLVTGSAGLLAINCSSHSSARAEGEGGAESGGSAGASSVAKGNGEAATGGTPQSGEPTEGGASGASAGVAGADAAGSAGKPASVGGMGGEGGSAAGAAGAVESGGAAGSGGAVGSACNVDSDCGAAEYCKKAPADACKAETTGECTAYTTGYSPVCGCNGVTYGNPKLIVGSKVNIRTAGECAEDVAGTETCSGRDTCSLGKCIMIVESSAACTSRIGDRGKCWVVGATADDCKGSSTSSGYHACVEDPPGCMSICSVVQKGIRAYRAASRKECIGIANPGDLPIENSGGF